MPSSLIQVVNSLLLNLYRKLGTSRLADLTVSKRPGTSYQIEINFAVVNHLYLFFVFVNFVET